MKYLGVDFGLRRVGLAISEGELASPLKILDGKNLEDLAEQVRNVADEEGVEKVVVGMPEGETGKATNKFINSLKRKGLDVEAADETLSTQNAQRLMIEMGVKKLGRRLNDAHAAAEILQNYLDDVRK